MLRSQLLQTLDAVQLVPVHLALGYVDDATEALPALHLHDFQVAASGMSDHRRTPQQTFHARPKLQPSRSMLYVLVGDAAHERYIIRDSFSWPDVFVQHRTTLLVDDGYASQCMAVAALHEFAIHRQVALFARGGGWNFRATYPILQDHRRLEQPRLLKRLGLALGCWCRPLRTGLPTYQ